MVIFRIIRYFIELLVRIILITGNNRHHFVWVIIYLAITEFLLRYKKPHLLFLLQCVHVLKRGLLSHHALYHSSDNYLKHKLNALLEPLKEEFASKTPTHYLRLINPVAYFFTKSAGFEDSPDDDSDDEESNPDEESQHGEDEENMEEISDFEYGNESDVAIGINTNMAEAFDSTSMLRTPQKRKAEAVDEINVKRSRSTDETKNKKHPSTSHLELETKTKNSEEDNTSLPVQSSSSNIRDGTSAVSNNRLIESYDPTMPRESTHDEIENFLERFQVSQVRSEDPCGNESEDSKQKTVELASTSESPVQSPSPSYQSHRQNVTPRDLKIIAAAAKEFFQKPEEKNCEIANQMSDENTAKSEKSSTVCADQKELTNNTTDLTENDDGPPKCLHHWDRPGTSLTPHYLSSLPCECDDGIETVENIRRRKEPYRKYPGLSLQPLRVKKDARYQKKFYKQKKETICPVKLGKIFRWALKISKGLSHNVPEVPDSDEEKLPSEIYHELAQELVQGFITAYNNAKKEKSKSKSLRDKDKSSSERKQKKNERANTGYTKSSFQEESPSSDDSPESPKKGSNSTGAVSRPPSETNLSMVSVSPIKPVGKVSPRVVVQAINWQPPLIDVERNEPESDQQLHQMKEETSHFGFIKDYKMNVCDIAYEEIVLPGVENLLTVEESLGQDKKSSSVQMEGQQSEASEAEFLRFQRARIESGSQSETENVISGHTSKDAMLRNLLDQPVSGTIEEREFARDFSNNILANFESIEKPSTSGTSRTYFPERAVGEHSRTLESPNVSPTPEEISATLCFANTSEEEQRAILESFKQSFSEKSSQDYFREISADNPSEISESSSSEENVTIRSIQEMFEVEQRAIMESLGLIKPSNDPEDRRNQFLSTEYVEIPLEINIYENQNLSEDRPITRSSTDHESDTEISDTELKEKSVSSSEEIPFIEENITDSLNPATEVEIRDQNIYLRPGLTQSPTIVSVRRIVDIESERKETCSLSSREEIENIGETEPSCSFRRDSSSEKSIAEKQKNVTELESPISPDSADEETEAFSKPSDEEKG